MRKFLLVYFPLFGVLAFIGLTPGNALMLLAAFPLLAIPYITVAAPTILLCLVALISLGVALAPQRKRFSRIAAAMLFAIVGVAVIAIGPGMLGRREAAEFAHRIAKDDISRAAASLPKPIDWNMATDRSPPR
jgi:hypothetical protein